MKSYTIDISKDTILTPSLDRRSEVYKWSLNGLDNQLPNILNYLVNESVTAKACVSKNLNAVIGKGYKDGKTKIHKDGTTLNQLLRQIGRSMVVHSNAFLHISYDANLDVSGIKFLPANQCRIGEEDGNTYSGKIVIADWSAKRINSMKAIDVFNSNKAVLKAQIDKAGDITKYKGQILHISKDKSVKYAPSDLYPALEDAELEKLSKTFRRNSAKFGFINTKAAIVPAMTDEEALDFNKNLKATQGAEAASNLIVFQASSMTSDVNNQLNIQDLTSNPDDKVLMYSDSQAETNICKAFGVPVDLISSKGSGIFGSSGELLKEMKIQLFEEQEYTRMLIEESINLLLSKFQTKIEPQFVIDPFKVEEVIQDETPKDINAEAQATLRGSVGGVTGLLAIQASVSAGTTTKESGIAVLVNIYGFTKEIASEMLGEPKKAA